MEMVRNVVLVVNLKRCLLSPSQPQWPRPSLGHANSLSMRDSFLCVSLVNYN